MRSKSKLKIFFTAISYWFINNLLDLAILYILGWWILAIIGIILLLLIIFSFPVAIFFFINNFPFKDFLYLFSADIIAAVLIFYIIKALLVDHIFKKGKTLIKKTSEKVTELRKKNVN